ncbi:MAG TPA: DegT/DnrJ/EryC1/StrS aminotransferase family protein [Nitrospirota bacterium]|nr:DegT/DnrJ/EryC1/StrS aminotransferase family protein [Nitrospirota bacterium]
MNIQRTLPPAAAPIGISDLLHGLTGLFRGAPSVRRLEKEVKNYFGVKHVFFVSSGKAAFFVILKALKSLAPEKSRVLIPAYTCYSVPSSIVKAGLQVSLCDITADAFDFDGRLLNDAVTGETLCVVADHLFGIPADLDRITRISKERGAFVVEDAAQAMGGTLQGRLLGTIGDVGFFSLGRGKNITAGSGGIIITNSPVIAQAIEMEYSRLEDASLLEAVREFAKAVLMSVFIRPSLFWVPSGVPWLRLGETIFYKDFPIKKLSGMQAGLLRNFRKRLQTSNEIRKENAAWFKQQFGMGADQSAGLPLLRLPLLIKEEKVRKDILARSREQGAGISHMYPTAINEIPEIRDQFIGTAYPAAQEVAAQLITLPTHHLMTKADRRKICACLNGQDNAAASGRLRMNGGDRPAVSTSGKTCPDESAS